MVALNAIIAALLKEFSELQSLLALPESEQFEHFVNYVILSDIYADEFNPVDINTGSQDFGLDGVALIVNGTLVEDADEIDELKLKNKYLDAEFIFTQAKTSSHFDAGELLKTLIAVEDFFGSLKLLKGEKILEKHALKEHLYANAASFRRGAPKISVYFATAGTWQDDANLVAIVNAHKQKLEAKELFSEIHFSPIGVPELRQLYFRTKNAVSRQIDFEKSVALPSIPNVTQGYVGFLPAPEYLKLITDQNGAIKKQLFFDNMRDFIADSDANEEIAETISSARRAEFPLRNNGVTVVARKLQRVGNRFDIEDYQIVNGCQTSHVLFQGRSDLTPDVVVPIKIIVTEDDEVTSKIIRGANVANQFDRSQLWAIEPFHKDVEVFFDKHFEGEGRLYYERRRGQFGFDSKIEKVRIVTPQSLLKAFASVVLDRPHDVTKYYSLLEPEVGKTIFHAGHDLHVYYLTAYTAFRLESLFRNKRISSEYKPCRHHLQMAFKYAVIKDKIDPTKKNLEKLLSPAIALLLDQVKSAEIFGALTALIDQVFKDSKSDSMHQLAKSVTLRDKLRAAAPATGFIG